MRRGEPEPGVIVDPDGAATALARAQRRLIVHRLRLFSVGWLATTVAWTIVLTLESRRALVVALPIFTLQLAALVVANVRCRRDPVAARVPVVAVTTSVLLGVSSIALFAAVGGSAEVVAFVLLTLYLASALLFAWGWRAESIVIATTLAAWVLAFPALRFVVAPPAFATALLIGVAVALAVAEGSARAFSVAFLHRASDVERKRELEASRDAYRDLAESARDFIYSVDLEARFTYVNEALARFIGEPVESIIGRVFVGLLTDHPANPDPWEVLKRIAAGEAFPPLLVQLRSAQGVRWMEALISGVQDANGRVIGMRGISRDVSERKAAEDALRASEERLRLLNACSPVGIFVSDVDRRCTYTNPRLQAICGFTFEEGLGHGWTRFIHPADRERVAAEWIAAANASAEYTSEFRFRAGPARVTWVHVRAAPVVSDQGRAIGYIGTVEDITERKRSERRSAAQHALTRVLAESATVADAAPRILQNICESLGWDLGALWLLDTGADVLRCEAVWQVPGRTPGTFASVGCARSFARGEGLPGRVWAAHATAWVPDVIVDSNFPRSALAATEGLHGACAFPIVHGNDLLGVVECFSREIESPDDEILRTIATLGTWIGQFLERERSAEALRASEQRYRGLIESQHDMILRMDGVGEITFVNDAYCTTFGLRRDAVLGRSAVDPRNNIVHRDDLPETLRAIRALDDPPHRSRVDNRVRTPDGWRWISWEACAIHDETGAVVEVQAVGRDVTERRAAEEALRGSLDELRASEEKLRLLAQRQVVIREDERKRLGFDLHDDVCQELVGIVILVESLRRRLAPLPPAAAAELDRIVRYLNEVVEHLRLLARELRPMLLHDLGLEGSFRSLAMGMSTELTRVVAEFATAIPRLEEDIELAVYRIAQEALANATRHASARTITLTLAVAEKSLTLEVRDDGCGFDLRDRQRSEALGLVSMEERALALGGRFEMSSEPGKGTAVRLECPLATRAPASAA
jgi:PAS domain S-box-containing protein